MPNHARIAWTGDLWDENTVEETDESGATTLKLIDFEATCVCGAVQDLVHVSTAPLVETYLRRVLGRQPTEDEVEALLLEARLAEHIHFYIHRPIFFDRQPAESFLQHHRFRDRGLQKTPFCVGIEHSASLNLATRPRICPRLRIAELKRLAWSSKLGKPSKKSIYKKTPFFSRSSDRAAGQGRSRGTKRPKRVSSTPPHTPASHCAVFPAPPPPTSRRPHAKLFRWPGAMSISPGDVGCSAGRCDHRRSRTPPLQPLSFRQPARPSPSRSRSSGCIDPTHPP